MSAGLKVNLGKIDEIAKKYAENAEIVGKIRDCEMRLSGVAEYYEKYESEVYATQCKIVEEVLAAVRSVGYNFPDISDDLAKYVTKMSEDDIVIFDSDAFVAKNLIELDNSFSSLQTKIYDLGTTLSNKSVEHTNYEIEFNMWNPIDEEDPKLLEKQTERQEMKALQQELLGNISTCLDNKNVTEYYRIASEVNQDIKDWYDRDFDASDHASQIAKFVFVVVAEAAVTFGLASIGAPAMVGVALIAGVNGLAAYEDAYYSGSTSGEATTIASVTFTVNLIVGGLGAHGDSQVASRESAEFIEHIETGQIDDVVEVAAKHGDDYYSLDVLSATEFDQFLDDMNVDKVSLEDFMSITRDVANSKSEEEGIETLDEYLDGKGLECSDESIKLLVAILRDGTK